MNSVLIIGLALFLVTGSIVNVYAQQDMLSPLKQFESGIQVQDIKCESGLSLLINQFNGEPACVMATSATRLLAIGWVTPDKFIPLNQTSQSVIINNENTRVSSSNSTANVIPISNSTANLTTQTKNVMPVRMSFNGTSNATSTGGNGTLTPDEIFELYKEFTAGTGGGTQIAGGAIVKPLPMTPVNYTATSNHPGTIKILMIGISPYPLKVGDMPVFTMTWQNVSDKPLYQRIGQLSESPLCVTILPTESAVGAVDLGMLNSGGQNYSPINPGQINTNYGFYDPTQGDQNSLIHYGACGAGYYNIIKAGVLHVIMNMGLAESNEMDSPWDVIETVNFDLNVTQ
ncbi:MAG: hypothetical protein WCC52_04955 [Nitrosotalea sp.]